MCGIAGFSGDFSESILERMNQVIAHRGPDDAGIYFDLKNGIGLAHRRLSIIDLSPFGHQPMWDITGTVAIVYNGEIYNYKELREELIKSGFVFKSHSDTEVLLNLYLRDGRDLLSKINGIFAFALWDTSNNSLLMARDGIGVKPLYYTETSKGFLFASEIKAILQEPSIDRTLNPNAVHYHLSYLWSPAPHTILKGVKKLEPGHALIVKDSKIKKQWQFYELPFDQAIEGFTEEKAINAVQTHLSQAVRRQMVADVPVGAFLSGGLDSSSVVSFARQHNTKQKLQCFTIGFRDESFKREGMADDLPYAQRVAEHLDVDLHTIYVGPEMADHLEKMIYHLDEPQADPAPINVLFISQLAREHGIKVLLSGAGGDDIFTGYRRHYALMLEKYWSWLPVNARRSLSRLSRLFPLNFPTGRRLAKAIKYADLDENNRIASYFFWNDQQFIKDLYSPAFRDYLDSNAVPEPLAAYLACIPPDIPALNRMLYLEGKHFLADHNLNYTDKMSMAVGVEVRVPLLDPDLVALAARLPVSFKQNGRIGKWVFKKAMEPYLPRGVIYRPKTGFGAPLRHWLHNKLRPLVEDVLSKKSLNIRGIFDPKGVDQLIQMDQLGKIDGTYTIFSLMCIELWCRIFIDQQ